MTTDTPRTDACPHCGAELYSFPNQNDETTYWRCGTDHTDGRGYERSLGCYEKERSEFNAKVERLKEELQDPIEFLGCWF